MITKKVQRYGHQFEIKVEKLKDGSYEAGIFCDGKQIVKMSHSTTDSSRLRNYRGEDPSILITRLLEDYVRSGFVKIEGSD
jgi:hypothetical protein